MKNKYQTLIILVALFVALIVIRAFSQNYPTETCVVPVSGGSPLAMASCNSGIPIPEGNTASRAAAASVATIRLNTDTNLLEFTPDAANWFTLSVNQIYDGTTLRTGAFPIFKTATVSSGTAIFNFTNDGTSGGTALFPNGPISASVQPIVNDATAPYQFSWVWSNSNKTLTVTTNKASGVAVLTFTLLGLPSAAPNGTSVSVQVWGY